LIPGEKGQNRESPGRVDRSENGSQNLQIRQRLLKPKQHILYYNLTTKITELSWPGQIAKHFPTWMQARQGALIEPVVTG
jgi:hypothetical protein